MTDSASAGSACRDEKNSDAGSLSSCSGGDGGLGLAAAAAVEVRSDGRALNTSTEIRLWPLLRWTMQVGLRKSVQIRILATRTAVLRAV